MHAHFLDDAFAEEIRFVFREVHIILIAERGVHDHQGVQREVGQLIRSGIDPPNGSGGLQTESCLIGKTAGEIIRITGLDKSLELAQRSPQVMGAEHAAVLDLGDVAVVTAVHAQIDIA